MHHRNRLETIVRAIREFVPAGGDVLDIGCAQGNISLSLAEQGYHVLAVDADPDALAYAKLRYEFGDCSFLCADATRYLQHLDRRFDGIVLGEVIEHVPQPGALLGHCWSHLKSSGVLVITTPNGSAPHNRRFAAYDPHKMEAAERGDIRSGLGARETHLLNFRQRSLLDSLRAQHFDILRNGFLESYAINPIGLHRVIGLRAARRVDRRVSDLPFFAQFLTLRLYAIARKAGEPDV